MDEMRIWLLKNKQTCLENINRPPKAVYALVATRTIAVDRTIRYCKIGTSKLTRKIAEIKNEAGRYFKNHDVMNKPECQSTIPKTDKGLLGGGYTRAYFEDLG